MKFGSLEKNFVLFSVGLAVFASISTLYAAEPKIAAVYCSLLLKKSDPQLLLRLKAKSRWHQADIGTLLERRVKLRTNLQRKAGQRKGLDESADPAAPFTIGKNDPHVPGMPLGVYWSNSGQYFFHSPTISAGLHGGPRATRRYEFVYMYRTPDGRIVHQQGGYADAGSSWGWDGRFEYQPDGNGGYELVVTQGSMELPSKMRGAPADAADLPEVSKHNASRSRHVFKVVKFENGKLYLLDEGSILGNRPDINGDWISYETKRLPDGRVIHLESSAHGYGENFIPLATDHRKLWSDEFGYPIRIFDLVTREVHIEKWVDGKKIIVKEPATTQSVAYRMDPKNASKRVARGILLPNGKAADEGILIMAEDLPKNPGVIMKSSVRMKQLSGNLVEVRTLNLDGTVLVERGGTQAYTSTLVEGFNPVPGVVKFPSGHSYYLGTFSASEYTAGAKPEKGKKQWRYGAYLGFRFADVGPLGRYTPVIEETVEGRDFVDFLEEFTELYGLSWGAGRPQVYRDERGGWWLDVHFVDTDRLPEGLPKAGYPEHSSDFADAYRRHKASLPIRWVEKNGQPAFEIDDPAVHAEILRYRKKNEIIHRTYH